MTQHEWRPEMWKSGLAASDSIGGFGGASGSAGNRKASRAPRMNAHVMYALKLRWVMTAPLGRPVVPLVNRIVAGSSSMIGWSGSDAPGAIAQRGEVVFEDHHRDAGVTGQPCRSLLIGEEQLGGGEFDAVSDLVFGPPSVHRHHDCAERGDRPEGLNPLGGVRGEDRNTVPVADAVAFGETSCQRRRSSNVLRKGGFGSVIEHVVAGAAIATVVGGVLQQGSEMWWPVLGSGDLDPVDGGRGGLEEAARPGEKRVNFGDRHGRLRWCRCRHGQDLRI